MSDHVREMQAELNGMGDVPEAERRDRTLRILVDTLGKALALGPDEVAVLLLTPDREMLGFAYPPELSAGGSNAFPVSFPSVAGRVLRTGEGYCTNHVQEEPHLAFYERVPVQGKAPTSIRKLLAVPLRGPESSILGVVEISRRGGDLGATGADFGSAEQRLLEQLVATVAPALHR